MGRFVETITRRECGLRDFVGPYKIFDLRFSFFYGLLQAELYTHGDLLLAFGEPMLQLYQRLAAVRDVVLFVRLLVHGFLAGNRIVLTFSSLSISAYVLPLYSKIASQPVIYQILILCKTQLDVHLPNFAGPLGRTIVPCTSVRFI
jgi:hypothetical protein